MEVEMKYRNLVGLCFILLLASVASVYAHSGGTDKFGGHRNRKQGGYHYHNAGRVHAADNPYQDHKRCGICPSSKAFLQEESKGQAQAFFVQSALVLLGYDIGVIDGNMDRATRSALKDYQRTSGLGATGNVDQATQRALLESLRLIRINP